MGRSGGGGGGGHSGGFSHSSGSRGFSRSGGSSSRSGAGSSGRSGGSFGSSYGRTSYSRHYHYGPSYGVTRVYSPGGGGGVMAMLMTVFVVFILAVAIIMLANSSSGTQSTIQREKLSNPDAWVGSCIVDELGWMNNNGSKAKKGMHEFWEETGVQPYIALTNQTSDTDTDAEREAWAQEYFDTHCSSTSFLYVYFETGNSSIKGPDVVWWGPAAASVLDDEAVGIFLNYLDSDWDTWDADDTDGMFQHIYSKTADTIMKVSTTGKDIMKWFIIAVVVVVVIAGVIVIMNKKRKAERERAEETERILQAGQNQAMYGSSGDTADDLTSKYD